VADLGCSRNAAVAFDFFVRRGLRDFQAAAIVGNLQWESKLNPRLDVPDPTKSNPGARGRGIAGWGPPRWQNLLAFAAERDPWSLDVQLEFLWHELQSAPSFGLEPLLAATTAADATIVFQDRFEHPDPTKAHADKRIELANAALFACPLVRPPPASPRGGIWAAAAGALALAAATGYGVYKAFTSRALEPGRDRSRAPSGDQFSHFHPLSRDEFGPTSTIETGFETTPLARDRRHCGGSGSHDRTRKWTEGRGNARTRAAPARPNVRRGGKGRAPRAGGLASGDERRGRGAPRAARPSECPLILVHFPGDGVRDAHALRGLGRQDVRDLGRAALSPARRRASAVGATPRGDDTRARRMSVDRRMTPRKPEAFAHRWDVFSVLDDSLIGGVRGKNTAEALRRAREKWPSLAGQIEVKRRRQEK